MRLASGLLNRTFSVRARSMEAESCGLCEARDNGGSQQAQPTSKAETVHALEASSSALCHMPHLRKDRGALVIDRARKGAPQLQE